MDPQESGFLEMRPRGDHPHKHTIIWIHGLNETPQNHVKVFESDFYKNFKIILPKAPVRPVTVMAGKSTTSWFDIKFRNEKSFIVPFDDSFSTAEVIQSFEKILKPIIIKSKEELIKSNPEGKLFIGGFSQGCGMSLHCFFDLPEFIDGEIGVGGYLFPFTKFHKTSRPLKIIYGAVDNLRPWEYVKVTYEGKISPDKIILLEGVKHEISQNVIQEIEQTMSYFLDS